MDAGRRQNVATGREEAVVRLRARKQPLQGVRPTFFRTLLWVALPRMGMSGISATGSRTTAPPLTSVRFRGTPQRAEAAIAAVAVADGVAARRAAAGGSWASDAAELNSSNFSNSSGSGNSSNSSESNGTDANDTAPTSTTTPAPTQPARPKQPPHVPWVEGTWTTGYWDCCKPSCSWPGKGRVDRPVLACDAGTGQILSDGNVRSVCDGGSAASCHSHQPFLAHASLAFGFAAAAVSGNHGLTGDDNCGECYELRFVNRMHDGGVWGGAHGHLVNKTMVVQVTNIGYDVTGAHSFDIQVPGAGQGIFSNGCRSQYQGFATGDFDCDNRYGGCMSRDGCGRLPKELQPGCEWRYDWFHWFKHGGQTNNPWVKFRRVRCPRALTAITGSTPLDDHLYRGIEAAEYL